MALHLTAEDLIANVKRRIIMPTNQSTFTDDDILAIANEELQIGLIPSILSMHEDYFLYEEDVALKIGVNNYPIPYRAIGNKLRDLAMKDSNGNIIEMSRSSVDFLSDYNVTNRSPYSFYVKGAEIQLLPGVSANTLTGYLHFSYYLRPNEIVKSDRVATVLDINTTTGEITVDKIPTVFTLNSEYDFIQKKSPHKILNFDKKCTLIKTTSPYIITFNPSDIPSSLVVGDQICLAGETNIPNIPTDLHIVLAHRVAVTILNAQGDAQGSQLALQKLGEMEAKTQNLIDNRVEAAPVKVLNRYSPLKNITRFRRRRGF